IDESTFEKLVERQLEGGVSGLVPCGTTGETPALEPEEWEWVVRRTVELAGSGAPVIAGTGSNNTGRTVERTRRAAELGASAALVVTPYYNKPNHAGLVAHYEAVAGRGGLPVVVYNVPSRTGLNLSAETVLELARIPGVVAVKEASGSLGQAMSIVSGRAEGLALLSGEDDLTCAMTLMGGDGVISVVSNVDPGGTAKMVEAALAGDAEAARSEHYRLLPLVRALFVETNPVPAKAALALLRLAPDVVRPPLAAASAATRDRLAAALTSAGLM
ncbi:MAG: 4-hydroxy-tetrahydrodipicolinate synthase, partial [Acidobacteriota bacterium]|nr:4-hydroxy-tetrahydrodipicolinate synthase [Acidobacteriota bacterium]